MKCTQTAHRCSDPACESAFWLLISCESERGFHLEHSSAITMLQIKADSNVCTYYSPLIHRNRDSSHFPVNLCFRVYLVQFKSLKPSGREASRKTDESVFHDEIGEALSQQLGRAHQARMCRVSLLKGNVLFCRAKPWPIVTTLTVELENTKTTVDTWWI